MINLKKNKLYLVDGQVEVYLGRQEKSSNGRYDIYEFRNSEGRAHWVGFNSETVVEVGVGRNPKLRTLKAVNAELDGIIQIWKIDKRVGNATPEEKAKWQALCNEKQAIRLVRAQRAERKAKKNDGFEAIYREAHEAGLKAGNEAIPTPMVVQSHANQLDDNSPVKQEWYVSEGACGFAWVNVRDRKFGLWLKAVGYGDHDSYYKGFSIWVGQFGQSITRKEAYAGAFARVLEAHGIEAHSNSRLD
jgi:hypothetical protein